MDLSQGFPRWQVLVIDLRCHGESASLGNAKEPHNVMTSARDVLSLLSSLKLFPQVIMLLGGRTTALEYSDMKETKLQNKRSSRNVD